MELAAGVYQGLEGVIKELIDKDEGLGLFYVVDFKTNMKDHVRIYVDEIQLIHVLEPADYELSTETLP